MAKLTLEERRLKSLKLQLFGKEQNTKSVPKLNTPHIQVEETVSSETARVPQPEAQASLAYVKADLMKILLLVTMAMSIQLILYFASSNHLIRLNNLGF